MDDPLVCAVCLTKDRPALLRRAVASFKAQTYQNKRLLIVNSGQGPLIEESAIVMEPCFIGADALTIGGLRNLGNKWATACLSPDIFVHWDDDDVSHPNRIAEQVAMLQASGADIVGYRDLLFWAEDRGEAYLYQSSNPNYCIGTSLCYWRRTWDRVPFSDKTRGEDTFWQREHMKRCAVSSILWTARDKWNEPRLIAGIHQGNAQHYLPEIDRDQQHRSYERVTEWDSYCRRMMSMNDTREQLSGNPTGEASADQVYAGG